jgi:hypothetical protein
MPSSTWFASNRTGRGDLAPTRWLQSVALRPTMYVLTTLPHSANWSIATGQVAQLTYHLNRAVDNGPTKPRASEVMTQNAALPRQSGALGTAGLCRQERPLIRPLLQDIFNDRERRKDVRPARIKRAWMDSKGD